MGRRLGQQVSLFSLSLLLAFFFWTVAIEAEDPTVVDTYATAIPVEVHNLPKDVVIVAGMDAALARVKLRTPQSVWDTLRSEAINVYVDLTGAVSGTVTVPVFLDIARDPVQIVEIIPPELTFRIESLVKKQIPVVAKLQGTAAAGYRVDVPIVIPESVSVEGPASLVNRVTEAQVTVPLQGRFSDVASDFNLKVVDAKENAVTGVEVVPKTVTVNVPVSSLGYFRDVPVSVVLNDRPAPGYRLVNLEVTPQLAKVVGVSSAVQSVRYLQTIPVSLSGLTRSLTTTLALQIPGNISVLYPPTSFVTVSVMIEAIRNSVTLELEPQIQGLGEGLTVSVEMKTVFALVSGPLSVTQQLTATNASLVLDLTGLNVGDYTIKPLVTVPSEVVLENVIPELIPVNIKRLSLLPTILSDPENTAGNPP
ncbi:MAG: hypothetical protein JXA33_25200 [Anaerolineae bacterium]|nr:hypothetical protein [Anaerolineae bacterium]